MKCGYCNHEFTESEGITGCGQCGKPASCRMIRCPRCFYENPPETAVVKSIRKLFRNKKEGVHE